MYCEIMFMYKVLLFLRFEKLTELTSLIFLSMLSCNVKSPEIENLNVNIYIKIYEVL